MSIQLRWDDPDHTILLYTFTPPWQWDEYYRAADSEWDLLDAVNYRVDTILDVSDLDSFPKDAATHFKNAGAHVHRNRGLLLLVGKDQVIMPFCDMLREIYPRSIGEILLASTLTRARTFVSAQYGSTLEIPPITPDVVAAPLL